MISLQKHALLLFGSTVCTTLYHDTPPISIPKLLAAVGTPPISWVDGLLLLAYHQRQFQNLISCDAYSSGSPAHFIGTCCLTRRSVTRSSYFSRLQRAAATIADLQHSVHSGLIPISMHILSFTPPAETSLWPSLQR